jgi:hypothetical protein
VRRTLALLATLLAGASLPTAAHAAQTAQLHATLTPERLGHDTTIGFGFQIAAPDGRVPPALTEVNVSYPGNLGLGLSGLGLATCSPARLEALGDRGCPANSRMGYGTALAEIAIGSEILEETAHINVFRGTTQQGHLALLVYATGESPVSAQIVFPALLLPAPQPFGGRVHVNVPLVPSLPGAPNVAVVQFSSTLGPLHITYHEYTKGRTIAYHPKGLLLPDNCPRGGFPFAAEFTFEDGSHADAQTTVPCPRG